jgi:membrane-bound PQQ-dependent dehydrogenase (glucose/quinate/shikimate family)
MNFGRRMIWLSVATLAACAANGHATADDWPFYGRDAGNTRYSPLDQITVDNVGRLRLAWTFHTGDVADRTRGTKRSGFETTPLVFDGRLYLTTPFNRVIALDASSGSELWAYDPKIDKTLPYDDGLINRGLASWRDPAAAGRPCALRLFEATLDARLVALDAASGMPCSDFGTAGQVELTDVAHYRPGLYHMTSPPIVIDGVLVVGSSIGDNTQAEMPAGVVRGYDARSGKLLWRWEPLQRPAGVAPGAWKTGAANAWSILGADPQRHLVYVPTGSASPDYYGGLRPGDNRWANSVVALNPKTGRLVWGFQLVHHDLFDYDSAAPPVLTSLTLNGQRRSVLVAGNKSGMLYVLDPSTGKPVLPIEERAVPQSTVPGEVSSATQPFPVTLPALAPQSLEPRTAGLDDTDRSACRDTLEKLSGTTVFSPPSLQGALSVPGPYGGINWSGFAWDAKHERVIVPVSNFPWVVQLVPADQFAAGRRGDFPEDDSNPQTGTLYGMVRGFLRAPSRLPCAPPPWGELVALDLANGKIAWRRPLGTFEEPFPGVGKRAAGSVIFGGPIVTAGGVVFIGGAMDRHFRAFSSETGEELWSTELGASAHATPITYEVNGKQFVVIAAGGHTRITEEAQSDALVAFALP